MGMDHNSNLGYGFKVTDESIIEKLNEGEIKLPDEFTIDWSGDAWTDTAMQTFIFIKDSIISTYVYQKHEKPIDSDRLIPPRRWREDLEELAICVLGIKDPKIGWWLLNSIS